ncbi:dihydroorotase [Bacteroidia bacterium]|nr:dihydroorotase [Bacteroidia bacterium]
MVMATILKNALIINEYTRYYGHILVSSEHIHKILPITDDLSAYHSETQVLDCSGCIVIPGLIDDQVHFREPGLTHKGDILSESHAAVAGGVTSFMDMPNTNPQALTQEVLEQKYALAAEKSLANYSFYMGASNTNIEDVLQTDFSKICGVKIFMGSSTGNMLLDDDTVLEQLFSQVKGLIAVHCENETRIRERTVMARERYGNNPPLSVHSWIRDEETCYSSSLKAVTLARKHNTKLHVLHLSTAKELTLFSDQSLANKSITAEVSIPHLWFTDADYERYGTLIKCNPAVKTLHDREALRQAVIDGRIDVLATDHAPHTWAEKQQDYFKAPSGIPMIQHWLVGLLELERQGIFTLEQIVAKTAHNPAQLFKIQDRGFIREGYYADLTVVDTHAPQTVEKQSLLSKCGWSPLEQQTFHNSVKYTFVNGHLTFNQGILDTSKTGQRLLFNPNTP